MWARSRLSGRSQDITRSESFKGRNRESQVPAMLELLDIPYTGSDPATRSIAVDKALAKNPRAWT